MALLSQLRGTFKIRAIEGTSSIPGQTAIIYASGTINRLTAFSVVDAQYFTDLMNSLDDTNHSVLLLRFSDGPVISVLDRDPPHTRAFIGEFRSAYSQAHLLVITPIHALGHYVLRYMMFLGPMSLLLTLAALYLLQRWQKRKMSLAEEIRKGMAAGNSLCIISPCVKLLQENVPGLRPYFAGNGGREFDVSSGLHTRS